MTYFMSTYCGSMFEALPCTRNHVTLQDKIIEELRRAKLANRTAARIVPQSHTRFSLGKTESICEKTIEYVPL